MSIPRFHHVVLGVVATGWLLLAPPSTAARHLDAPERLTDAEFWTLSGDMSEPDGTFRSENLSSNEMGFQTIIPDLKKLVRPGIYMGVGPEQNFTYIASLQPKMAFITDIRRGNLNLHLMYKALFEMSADRADFVGLLFSKKRPDGLSANSSVGEIFSKYDAAPVGTAEDHLAITARIVAHLTKSPHTLPLGADDLDGVRWVHDQFYAHGTGINYNSANGGGPGRMAAYESLMVTNDGAGVERSYLANEELFGFVKRLESRNLLVPVVGNFAGPKALRAVGRFIRERGETVQAFYLSNVEDYLTGGLWSAFCNNVASLPLGESSTFIYGARAAGGGGFGGGLGSWYRPMAAEVKQFGCKP